MSTAPRADFLAVLARLGAKVVTGGATVSDF